MSRSEHTRDLPRGGRQDVPPYAYGSYHSGYTSMGGSSPGSRPLTVKDLEDMARRSTVPQSPGQMGAVHPFEMQGRGGSENSLFGDSFLQPRLPQEVSHSGVGKVVSSAPMPQGNPPMPSQGVGYLHQGQYVSQPPTYGMQQQNPGGMGQNQMQHQQDMISDSIAALLQSDLRLSPEEGTIKKKVPLPKENVILPRPYLVHGVCPIEVIHFKFFEENPYLWELYNSDFDANINEILQLYIKRSIVTDEMHRKHQLNSTESRPSAATLATLPFSDASKSEEDSAKQKYVKQEREERWVDIMDHRHDGRKPVTSMGRLNDALVSLAEELSPIQEDKIAWMRAFEYTKKVINASFPSENVRVILFGSVANGLAVKSSNDIDVSVECQISDGEKGEEEKASYIESIGKVLELDNVQDLLILSHARVPVVKFVYPPTQTQVDITIKNTLACLNTRMIADYCQIDPRLAQLVHIVKHWAKKRNVNDPYKGTLSSYCYVLMCIFHLQTRSPPILPVLQDPKYPATVSEQVGEWRVEYFNQVSDLKKYKFESENTQSLANLVWEFFEFWAWKHNYLHDVVSIRLGKIISKESKDWTKRVGRDRHLLCVEDPFLLSHDLGRTVDMKSKDVMRKEFFRAATILRDFNVPEDALFEPYTARQRTFGNYKHVPGRNHHRSRRPDTHSNNRH